MSRRFFWLPLAAALLVAAAPHPRPAPAPAPAAAPALAISDTGLPRVAGQAPPEGRAGERLLPCAFYERDDFARGVAQASAYPLEGDLRAGVVPHHLLAGRLIASFFAAAAQSHQQRPYEAVVFVGPSHYPEQAAGPVATTRCGWATPFGTLENDRPLTARLVGNAAVGAVADDAALARDHAIAGLIPYAGRYLPGVPVAAVLVGNRAPWPQVEALAQALGDAAGQRRILLVCSTDFSHYLSPGEAALRDAETRDALRGFDFLRIAGFSDDHMDSPQTITVFLRFARRLGAAQIDELAHSRSDLILNLAPDDPMYSDGVTSYFILAAQSRAQ